MTSSFIAILLFFAAGWFWLDSARARELAVAICKSTSQRYGLQFLDDTVVLHRVGLRWPNEGLRIRRVFRFEFSQDGVERHNGFISLVGIRLENIDFGMNLVDPAKQEKHRVNDIIPIRKD